MAITDSPENKRFYKEQAIFHADLMAQWLKKGEKTSDTYRKLSGALKHFRWICANEDRAEVDRHIQSLRLPQSE